MQRPLLFLFLVSILLALAACASQPPAPPPEAIQTAIAQTSTAVAAVEEPVQVALEATQIGTPSASQAEPPAVMPSVTEEPLPTATSTAITVTSLEQVQRAVVAIRALGSFVDPDLGPQWNVAGLGSGFIVDEAGIVVTNNHVVTGAASLNVWVRGEDRPRNARVLGVSECSDLAVIDIDGEGFPHLRLGSEQLVEEMTIYAVGYSVNEGYQLTEGTVSDVRARGESSWASIDAGIEHTATLRPGNSGGPLVTEDAEVVGINYASNQADPRSNYAISVDEALSLITQLRGGSDVASIGINGAAVALPDAGIDGEVISGVWVYSVASGSPADQMGLRPGDLIVAMEEIRLATDGSLADYCDIIRSHAPGEPLSVVVLRDAYTDPLLLAGQIYGRALALAETSSPTATPMPIVPTDTPVPTATPPALPPLVLSPEPGVNCRDVPETCYFQWHYAGSLADNQYFQVQISPVGGTDWRGIHIPTRQTFHPGGPDLHTLFPDICPGEQLCEVVWSVAIVEWDGRDPNTVGRVLERSESRLVIL